MLAITTLLPRLAWPVVNPLRSAYGLMHEDPQRQVNLQGSIPLGCVAISFCFKVSLVVCLLRNT